MQDTTPDRSWVGVKKILIISDFRFGQVVIPELSAERLCQRIQMIASAGSPVPVSCTRIGDPHLEDADAAVLTVQAAVREPTPGNSALVYVIRRQRIGGLEPAPVYFGSAPQAVPLSSPPNFGTIDAALRQSLGEILPWLHAPEQPLKPSSRRGE